MKTPRGFELDSGIINPGGVCTFILMPAYPFRLMGISVEKGSEEFIITNIDVGKFAQLVEEVPAEFFSKNPYVQLMLEVCMPHQEFSIRVLNNSKQAAHFKASLYGTQFTGDLVGGK